MENLHSKCKPWPHGARAAPTCCGVKLLLDHRWILCSAAVYAPLATSTWNLGSRDKGDWKENVSEETKLMPEDFLTEKSFKALWHVLRAKPPSHKAARTAAMPFCYFTLQCKAASCFSEAVRAASLLQLSLLLAESKGRDCLLMYLCSLSMCVDNI